MRIHDGPEPQVGLDRVLLDKPPPRYLSPWSRFYFRSTAMGYQWHPHDSNCWQCGGELTVKLDLPLRADRQADPYQAVICLNCGETVSFYRNHASIVVDASAWDEPDLSLRLLKRAIYERAQSEPPKEEWSFE